MAESSDKKTPQGPRLQLLVEGPLTASTLTVVYKANTLIGFYMGNHPGNPLQKKLKDQSGREFNIQTGSDGIGIAENLDLSKFSDIEKFNSLTAVGSDTKKSDPVPLAVPQASTKASQGKRLIIKPDEKLTTSYANMFKLDMRTLDENAKNGSSEEVHGTFTGPVKLIDADEQIIAASTSKFRIRTDNNGDRTIWFRILGDTEVSLTAKLTGSNEQLERKFEYI